MSNANATMAGYAKRREAIRADNLVKIFGKVTALAGVSLRVAWGETLGILGDNGAGKSTLIKILTGYHQPDSGQVFVDGQPVQVSSVDKARALGIECVYQDLALVNGLSIYHNMFLNRELVHRGPLRLLNHREMRRRAATALAEVGVDVPSIELEVGELSGGQRQAIAVARAVSSNARILLLDEPLAAMGAREARLIIELIERLKGRGDVAIVMIAHNYAQILEICDRVLLMQHGEVTFESQAAATSAGELLEIVRREYRAIRAQ
jgi:simple sugar transport system ATP-binding protein